MRALKKLSVNQVGYIPDMCFGYRPTQNNSCTTKAIAISFRDLEDVSYDDKIRRTIQSILESNKYDSVVFFYQVQRDYDYNKRLYMYFQEYKNVVFKEECLEWSDLSFYNRFRFTLSNRLHVLLLGLVHDVTPIPLLNSDSKTNKIIGIFKSIGLSGLVNEESNNFDINSILQDDSKWNVLVRDIKERQFEILQCQINSLFNLSQNK